MSSGATVIGDSDRLAASAATAALTAVDQPRDRAATDATTGPPALGWRWAWPTIAAWAASIEG